MAKWKRSKWALTFILTGLLGTIGWYYTVGPKNVQPLEDLKLYKQANGKLLYWETWEDDDTGFVHWGVVGQRGSTKKVRSTDEEPFQIRIKAEVTQQRRAGYAEFPEEKFIYLDVQYPVDKFGTGEDLDKREQLYEKLNELLGWTGLGHCNGVSIGGGTMDVGCVVVDEKIAQNVIAEGLKGTKFANYSVVYRLNKD